ncbi:isochorismatase family protein [Streptomyces fuscichromogenes]|uniref:N-carbamoylsarcosine amidase n=1 Tax=Streptomyces fuscichromogenes TaxID=1324013 RepID=A0A917XFT6_9ACTN|nr:isochorismatase family protein [Streptomyces fuscichromogenes]GGN20281.1 N-carbamoylsarcosine amidase [Streptomyces fuscichromogenes]
MSSQYGEETDTVYEDSGLGGRITRGERPAIVVVDLNNGFTDPAYPTGSDLTEVVEATATLIEAARPAGVPVIYTTIGYTAAEHRSVAWLQKAPGLKALRAGTTALDIDGRLPLADTDHVLLKKNASAFFGTGLAGLLAGLRVDTVLVCGSTTSGCIRATAIDSVSSGFPVLVPRECVGDRAPGPHEANLFDIDAKYGDVIGLDDAVSYVKSVASPV